MTTAKVKQILVNSPQKDKINNCWKQKSYEQRNAGLDSLQAPFSFSLAGKLVMSELSPLYR